MASIRTLSRSFAGGEITPELYGRMDLSQFQTGLALCRNMMILPHGPATERPGTEYILQCKAAGSRLLPFSFNTQQTYVIELGNQYIRFHTNGATVLDGDSRAVVSITNANPPVVTYTGTDPASDAWVYFDSVTGMTEVNGRYFKIANLNTGANTFELQDLFGNNIDATGWSAGSGGTYQAVFELASTYATADLFDINYTQSADVLTLTHPSYPIKELSRVSANEFSLDTVSFAPLIQPPTALGLSTSGSGAGQSYTYVVTAVSDTYEESIACTAATVSHNLSGAGNYIQLDWTAPASGPTPIRYNIYKREGTTTSGAIYGYVAQTDLTSWRDYNVVPDYSVTPPENDDPLSSSDNYPGAVAYFEQRRLFGNTNNNPIGFWMTRSGTESNMSRSIPLRDDDSIRGTMVSREVNEIRHFVPLSDLLVLTSGGEWKMAAASGGALTPVDVSVRPQAYRGAAKVVPQVTGNSVLYLQDAQTRVYEIQYSDSVAAYTSNDASIMVPHLTDDYTVVDMGYSKSPDQVLWCVRSDGVLLGCTYVPEHKVNGWHRHTTDGSFKSVAVVAESGRYAPYFIVERTINGSTVEYIERMHDRRFSNLEDWFGVDAGLSYSGSAATVMTGLWHLEGESVAVLADGQTVTGMTVSNGSITLPTAASTVHIGLEYAPMVKLLPVSYDAAAAGVGQVKAVNAVHLRLNKTSGIQVGSSETDLVTVPLRTSEAYDVATSMVTDGNEIEVVINSGWSSYGPVYISRTGPLPLTLVALSLEVEVGD